ncbi:ribonuclease P protein component 4 [Methanococcoides sp. FTZ1]|uniref:ribonuclease P protein component 4 n=1 Tax=Methanococcoides sp. FTZ1 TaxID=3439061 RepID=UPI003F877065
MARKKKDQKNLIKDIAGQRIEYLFRLAEESYATSPERSNRYISLARRIAMRYRVRFPSFLKRRICKDCHSFLVPGSSSRIRLHGRYMTITCLKCGKEMRYPYRSGGKSD